MCPGPAHGFLRAIELAGLSAKVCNDDVRLTSATGAVCMLFESPAVLVSQLVKESARFHILQHLSDRVNIGPGATDKHG